MHLVNDSPPGLSGEGGPLKVGDKATESDTVAFKAILHEWCEITEVNREVWTWTVRF